MQRNVWLSLLALLLSCNLFSAPVNKWYTGKKHNQFVYIQMNDSVAYAEYIYVDHHHIVHGKFDTLILKQSKFVGMFSEIDIHVQNYTFIPGHLALQPGKPEEAWNPMRNEGYMQYLNEKLTVKLGWTRFEFKEFRDVDHVNKNSDPFEYRKVMDAKFDSLYQFYTSGTTTRQFMRVTICDEKLWHKKYRIITDSEEILNLWKFLASSYPVKVKSW